MKNFVFKLLFLFTFTGFIFFTGLFLSNKSFGQENYNELANNISALPTTITNVSENSKNDNMPTIIDIKYPGYPPTITTGKINILFTTNDSYSGIQNISAVAHVFPFDGNLPIKLSVFPSSISSNNESHWEIPIVINTTGTYRVVIKALDNVGNPISAETTINAAIPEKNITQVKTPDQLNPKIAFVRPTFTEVCVSGKWFL